MSISREQAQQQLDAWLAASLAVSKGQRYSLAGREMTRADAAEIRQQIDFWERKLVQAMQGGRRLKFYAGVPH